MSWWKSLEDRARRPISSPRNDADVVEGDLGQEPLEAGPGRRGRAAVAPVLVDHRHPLRRPAQGGSVAGEGVLLVPRLAVLGDLLGLDWRR